MKKFLDEKFSMNQNGLFLCELPTGFGKTYISAQKICEYVLNSKSDRRIIFLTTLKKNLPEDDLISFFGSRKLYNEKVLRIRSNFEEVTQKIPELEIPDEFCNDCYNNLFNAVKAYNTAVKNGVRDKKYIEHLKEEVEKTDRSFRNYITEILKHNFLNKEQRLEAVRNDPLYTWIGKLYPAVFTDDYRVLLMSMDKFLAKNSVLVEPSYDFLKADFISNSIIFIDEFDAAKDTVKRKIIERSLGMKNDFLVLFRQIQRTINSDNMSKELRDAYREAAVRKNSRLSFAAIENEAENIVTKYHTNLSFKTVESDVDRKQNFLLSDGSFHTVLQKKLKYTRAHVDKQRNIVGIHFEDKKSYFQNRRKDDIAVYGMLRDINAFLRHFRIFLFEWARQYAKIENSRRQGGSDLMNLKNAVSSILNKLELTATQQELLTGEMCDPIINRHQNETIPDFSFYQNGFEIYEFEDSDSHNDSTNLNLVKVYDTPEKLLIYLARLCTVIGISATAEIPTVVGNYNLDCFKEYLGDNFQKTPTEVKERIRNELKENYKEYENGNIKIHKIIVKNDYPAKTLTELLREITDEEEISMICVNRINSMSVNKYFNYRYCNIFRAMLSFCRTRNIKSMLYLGMALPKKNNPEFDEELLRDLFEYANTASGAKLNADSLFVLRGDGFDEDKETLLNRLSNGEKIFIMSSYKTLGAGQNLQYPINDTSGFISLRECENERDNRFSSKDIDAIYLADITNLTSNTYTSRNFGETDLMNMLFQVEELYNNGELNFREKTNMIKLAFNSYSNVREHGIFPNILYEMPSIKMQASKDVIQACGRLCRTFVKNSDIYIFAEEKLLEKISPSEMRKRILPPEIEAVAQMSESLGKEYTYNENKILNLAETISTKGTYTIMSVLTKKWTSVSMTMWQQLREYALRYPTVSKEIRDSSRDLQKLYITSGAPQNSYLYSQYSDFSDVVIDFSNDVISFRNSGRAKQKGNTDEVAVYKMNEEESGLPVALKYNGMSDYFTSNGYALGFEPNDYMMSPVLFHNIYKGALGEFAGEFILRQERGIVLKPITDSDRFEVFDFEMNDGIYVDFKNWKFTYLKDREKVKEHILNKLDEIGGKRAYVIQLVGHKDFNPSIGEDERIVEIPGLIDENGTPIFKNINMIKEEDYIAADK